jgi:small-conductance mechanosensitive channel
MPGNTKFDPLRVHRSAPYLVSSLSVPAALDAPQPAEGPFADDEEDEQQEDYSTGLSRTARDRLQEQLENELLQKKLLQVEQRKLQLENGSLALQLLECKEQLQKCKDQLQNNIEWRRQETRDASSLLRQLEKAETNAERATARLSETLEHVNRLQAKLRQLQHAEKPTESAMARLAGQASERVNRLHEKIRRR